MRLIRLEGLIINMDNVTHTEDAIGHDGRVRVYFLHSNIVLSEEGTKAFLSKLEMLEARENNR